MLGFFRGGSVLIAGIVSRFFLMIKVVYVQYFFLAREQWEVGSLTKELGYHCDAYFTFCLLTCYMMMAQMIPKV